MQDLDHILQVVKIENSWKKYITGGKKLFFSNTKLNDLVVWTMIS